MKKYSGADELTRIMLQKLIENVVATDSEHVEIVWKFKDEVRKFMEIWGRSWLDDEADQLLFYIKYR